MPGRRLLQTEDESETQGLTLTLGTLFRDVVCVHVHVVQGLGVLGDMGHYCKYMYILLSAMGTTECGFLLSL